MNKLETILFALMLAALSFLPLFGLFLQVKGA